MTINFNQLAEETIELTKRLHQESYQNSLENEQLDLPLTEEICAELEVKHEGPGVVFYYDGGISTYCLRGIASDDLEDDFDLIERNDPKYLKQFRLKEGWSKENFVFYPCDDVYQAEIIADEILNKRFPKDEAIVCNISDPGFSWWLDSDEHSIKIYYQGQTIERDVESLQLGPLGDEFMAMRRFSTCLPFLKKFFPINEFSSSEKNFQLSCLDSSSESFNKFKKLFLYGEWSFDFLIEHSRGDERTFFLYLRELATLRSFWLFVRNKYFSNDQLLQ